MISSQLEVLRGLSRAHGGGGEVAKSLPACLRCLETLSGYAWGETDLLVITGRIHDDEVVLPDVDVGISEGGADGVLYGSFGHGGVDARLNDSVAKVQSDVLASDHIDCVKRCLECKWKQWA